MKNKPYRENECPSGYIFLGHFTPQVYDEIQYKTKQMGSLSYYVEADGSLVEFTSKTGERPVFISTRDPLYLKINW